MIFDWYLWPWIVAQHADDSGLSLATLHIVRSIEAVQRAIGVALYPAVRNFAKAARKAAEEGFRA